MRKLSELQRWILRAALYNRVHGISKIPYWQIKGGYFRLPLSHLDTEGWKFAKRTTPGYMAASNSVSRAAKRLEQRGLVTIESGRGRGYQFGDYQDAEIAPTAEGYAVAALIEKKTPGGGAFGFPPINRRRLNRIVKKSKLSPERVGEDL